MIKFLVIWMLYGLLCIMVASTAHMIRAMKLGYTAKTICEANNRLLDSHKGNGMNRFVAFIFGTLIWPVRIYQFFVYQIPYRMTLYELIQNEEDS